MPLYESIGNVVRRIYDMRIEGPPVLDVATSFPSAKRFSHAWQSIRDEARAVAQQMHRVPRFHEIMREQTSISANDMRDWRMFILKAYGAEFPRNREVCPTLAALVTASPDVLSASISFLAPGKHIPEHRGPFRGVLRFYLVLTMPLAADGRPAAVLKIAGTEHRLADGEYLLWDDTFPREVTNASGEVRTVLLLDVWRRGMPLDMRLLSHLLIFVVRVMARLRGVGGAIG
jgi:aspartate beta-hydroxylase